MKRRKIAIRAALGAVLIAGAASSLVTTGQVKATEAESAVEETTVAEVLTETELTEEGETTTGAAASDEVRLTSLSEVEGTLPDGLKIGSVDVSGLSGEEAETKVTDYVKGIQAKTITITVNGSEEVRTLADFGCDWVNEAEIASSLDGLNEGSMLDQYKKMKDVTAGGQVPDMVMTFDEETVAELATSLGETYDQEAVDAGVERVDGTFVVTESQTGVKVDTESLQSELLAALDQWDEQEAFTIEAATEITEPEVTTDMYEGFGAVLGTETTHYYGSSADRCKNVERSAANMNGHYFMPDEVISYNDMIAPVTEEGGYGYAASYVGSGQVNTIGGGICQTCTTLYVAALQAEMETVYRKNHSYAVDYEPASMDATVFPADNLDYQFKNNTGYPIYIEAVASNYTCTVTIYGVETRPANRTLEFRSVELSRETASVGSDEPDPSLKAGQVVDLNAGHDKIHSQLYKDVYIDGVLTESILISEDYYKEMPRNRRYGAPTDSDGNSDYYVRDDGYVVKLEDKDDPDAETYRLNPDGTFLDDPLEEDEEDEDDEDSKDSKTSKDDSKTTDDKTSKDSAKETTATATATPTPTPTPAAADETSAASEE